MAQIGENVARLAGMHLLSKVELAGEAGISRQAMQNIVSGHSQPSVQTLSRLAAIFGVPVDALLSDPKTCLQAGVDSLANGSEFRGSGRAVLRAVGESAEPATPSRIVERMGVSDEEATKHVRKIKSRIPKSLESSTSKRAKRPDQS